jgi:hypothetical protein
MTGWTACVPCPRCGAEWDEPCRSRRGHKRQRPHRGRVLWRDETTPTSNLTPFWPVIGVIRRVNWSGTLTVRLGSASREVKRGQ